MMSTNVQTTQKLTKKSKFCDHKGFRKGSSAHTLFISEPSTLPRNKTDYLTILSCSFFFFLRGKFPSMILKPLLYACCTHEASQMYLVFFCTQCLITGWPILLPWSKSSRNRKQRANFFQQVGICSLVTVRLQSCYWPNFWSKNDVSAQEHQDFNAIFDRDSFFFWPMW